MENLDQFIDQVKKDYQERGRVNSRFYGKPGVSIFKDKNEPATLNLSTIEFSNFENFNEYLQDLAKLGELIKYLNN
jgi:hypothetical protein